MCNHRSTPPQRNKIVIVSILAFLFAVGFFALFFHGKYPQKIISKLNHKTNSVEAVRNTAIDGWANCLTQLHPDADIVFFGDSITAFGSFHNYFPEKRICNLGLSGDTLEGMINRTGMIFCVSPENIFILGGINSIRDNTLSASVQEYESLVRRIVSENNSNVFCISVLPISEKDSISLKCSYNTITSFNQEIENIANRYGAVYIDLHSLLVAEDNYICPEFTKDGIHLTDKAYDVWVETILPYIE